MVMINRRNRSYSKFWIFILISILSLCIILGISYYGFRNLIFPQNPIKNGIPQSKIAADVRSEILQKHKGEEVKFYSKDGILLSGLLFKRMRAKANLLICHGYRGCKETHARFLDLFPQCNILLFDFRAHGQSEGNFTTIGYFELNDVMAAAEYIKKENLPTVIIGLSMGGAAALKALEKEPNLCDGLIIDSSYSNLKDEIAHGFNIHSSLPRYPFLPLIITIAQFYLGADISNVVPEEYIKNVKIPVFIIHSSSDLVTPTTHALTLYNNAFKAGVKVKLWITPPCPHPKAYCEYPDLYVKKVSHFLRKTKICGLS